MRWFVAIVVLLTSVMAQAAPQVIRCPEGSDATIDGLLDDWAGPALAHLGAPSDGAISLRCTWDGTALAIALDVADDRVVRASGGHEDQVTVRLAAGGAATSIVVLPGNAMAKAKIVAPTRVHVADALQPKGFAVELRVPAATLAGFSGSTPSIATTVTFHDADRATGGDDTDLVLDLVIELGDRKDLLDDFLAAASLHHRDVTLDALAELDPEHAGKERVVAGGAVIGILTEQFAFVTVTGVVREVKLLPLGARGSHLVSAVVRQTGNGGARDLLMLWIVHGGQLQPLVQIEVRKQLGKNVLESTWSVVPASAKKLAELVVVAKPAVGFTAADYNEEPASDADPILLPWDATSGGTGYTLARGALARRSLPVKKR
ncbi:MAG: hypothetical protein NT062_19900 [Proteobacteria bacterium]|nr:hypothetical protein [Pseudomonadota bacterium]